MRFQDPKIAIWKCYGKISQRLFPSGKEKFRLFNVFVEYYKLKISSDEFRASDKLGTSW